MERSGDDAESESLVPLKLGVRCDPCAITLLYREGNKTRRRVMPVRFLNKFGPVERVLNELKSHHSRFLKQVPDIKIEKMLRILQETDKGTSLEKALVAVNKQFSVDPNQDLNKLTDEELSKKKQLMDKSFFKNQLKEGDKGYEYDIQVNFDSVDKVDAGWDTEKEEDFWS